MIESETHSLYAALSDYVSSEDFEEYVKDLSSDSFSINYSVENDDTLVILVQYPNELTDNQKAQMAFEFLSQEDNVKKSFQELKDEISKKCVKQDVVITERLVDSDGNVFAEIKN